jgi:hypothetical protein
MAQHRSWMPIDLVGAVFSLPLVSLCIAVAIVAATLLVATGRVGRRVELTGSLAQRYVPEQRTIGFVASATILLFAAQDLVLGYVVDLSGTIAWWRYAMPLVWTCLGIVVVWAVIIVHGTTAPEEPVLTGARRTWLGFGPRIGLLGATVTLVALVATTVAAGAASSPDGEGRYVWLVVPVANEAQVDPIRVVFFGWAYGLPVLVAAAALAAATWAALHANAARAYLRPSAVAAETEARRGVAVAAVRLATAGVLLALAGAWRLIAEAGAVSSLTILGVNEGSPYEVAWRYAEFAAAAGWAAPALEVVAFALLLLVSVRSLLVRRAAPADPPPLAPEVARAGAAR